MARTPPSRVNLKRVTDNLRTASRKGDRVALTLALDQMRTLALSPRYWEKYLGLLRNPLARLTDLLVIKQGERIAHQKGKTLQGGLRRAPSPEAASTAPSETSPRTGLRRRGRRSKPRRTQRPRLGTTEVQPSLFD